MASTNQAINLGIDKMLGSIKVGKIANLTIMDSKYNVTKTILEGQTVFGGK